MNKKFKGLVFLLITFTYALGTCETQTLLVSEGKSLEANIAQDSMNRLMVNNDRILNVFGDEGSFVTQSDEKTGQIFIKPTVENGLKPLSLTLITENGLTQDLALNPSPMAAATLILKQSTLAQTTPITPQETEHNLEPIRPTGDAIPFSQQAVQLIKQAMLGELKPLSRTFALRRGVSGAQARFLKVYQADNFRVEVWSVKKRDQTLTLQEKDFHKPQDLALCLKTEGKNKAEKLFLYVLTQE